MTDYGIVRLLGGPMDGWLVKPNAPVLDPGWSDQGVYVTADPDEDGVPQATWVPAHA